MPTAGPILTTVDIEVEHYQLVRAAESGGQSSNKGAERPRRSNTGSSSGSDKQGIWSKLIKPIKTEKGAAVPKIRDDDQITLVEALNHFPPSYGKGS